MKLELESSTTLKGRPYVLRVDGDVLIASYEGSGTALIDAKSGKSIGELPRGSTVNHARDGRAVVTRDGRTVDGQYRWGLELWDLKKGERSSALFQCNPDDNVANALLFPKCVYGVRAKRAQGRQSFSIVRLSLEGEIEALWPVKTSPAIFHLAISHDQSRAAHVYFTAKGGLLDLASGKDAAFKGGVLRIGRQHHKGVSLLSFDAKGEHVLSHSAGSEVATVWRVSKRDVMPGSCDRATDAFFLGDDLCVVRGDGREIEIVVPDGSRPPREAKTKGRGAVLDLGTGHHLAWVDTGTVGLPASTLHVELLESNDLRWIASHASSSIGDVSVARAGARRVLVGYGKKDVAVFACVG